MPLFRAPKSAIASSIAAVALLAAFPRSLDAATYTWTGLTSGLWTNTNNWNPTTGTPGVADDAIFNGLGNGNTTIDLSGTSTVLSLRFDTSSVAAYTIGTGGAGGQTLRLANSGSVTMASTVVADQLISARLSLGIDATSGSYTFMNDSLGNSLTFAGPITGGTGGTAGVKTLTLGGAGSMTISGSLHQGGGTQLTVSKTGAGTVTLSGVSSFSGPLTVSRGILAVTGTTNIGAFTTTVADTGTARMNISGNYTTQRLNIGGASGAVGAMFQTGGTTSVTQGSTLGFQIGQAAGAYGYYGMTSGSFSGLEVGVGGNSGGAGTIGILDVSGGTFDINGWLTVNRSGNAGSSAVLNLSGNGTVISRGGNGLQSSGGSNTYNIMGSSTLRVTPNVASTLGAGDFNLAGGTFETTAGVTSTGRINLNGGTIKSLGNNTLIAAGTTTLFGNGVTIDTGTFSSTITPAIVAATGTGVSSMSVSNAGSGYVAPPLVTLSGGGGTGATAFATITNGTISAITVTNPGTGYTSAPTVSFTGGGGTGASAGAPVMAANTTGVLTKTGSGALTLSASSSYTGGTRISVGTIRAGNNAALGTGTITFNGGGLSSDSLTARSLTNAVAFTGDGTLGDATNTGPLALSGVIDLGGATRSLTVLSSATLSGIVSNGGLTKLGTGVLTLSASNTYTGATRITTGTLALASAGSIASSGTVIVGTPGSAGVVLDLTAKTGTFAFGANQTVGGIGTINIGAGKAVSVAGVWAPGNTVGTGSVAIGSNTITGDLTLSGTSLYELGTPGSSTTNPGMSDLSAVSGTLTLGGVLTLVDNATANGQGSYGAGSYRLFTYGAISGSYASVTSANASTRGAVTYGGSGTAAGQGVFLGVYNLAVGSVASGTSVNLGVIHAGGSFTAQTLAIANTAAAGNFSEGLNASVTGSTGNATSGGAAITNLTAGGTSSTITVNLADAATAGVKNGSLTIGYQSNGSSTSGLPTIAAGSQAVNVTGSVFSGTGTWNVAGGGAWGSGASGSWTSTGGVGAAPGTFAGYATTDSAIFAGSQTGTSTILLNGAAPSLASLVFSNTANRYVIDQGSGGSLTLAAAAGKPTIEVAASAVEETGRMVQVYSTKVPEVIDALPPTLREGLEITVKGDDSARDFVLSSKKKPG